MKALPPSTTPAQDPFAGLRELPDLTEFDPDLPTLAGGGILDDQAAYGPVNTQPDFVHRYQPRRRSTVDLLQAADARHAIGRLPEDGETAHMVLSGRFQPFWFIPTTRELAGCDFRRIILSTLSFSADNGADMLELIDSGQTQSLTLLCSHWFCHANYRIWDGFSAEMKRRGQRIGFTRTHTKTWLMQMLDGRCYVIESSANIRSCKCSENAMFTQSRELFDFHAGWIDRVLTEAEAAERQEVEA